MLGTALSKAKRNISKDIDVIDSLMQEAQNMNEIFVVAAHGPPLGQGKYDLDYAVGGGNVGDEKLVDIITKYNVY